jgi:hypothetical protein
MRRSPNEIKKERVICLPESHEWAVFSTALADVCLMTQCVKCGAIGTVDDPTKQEWSQAFAASEEPYLWEDNSRVTIRQLVSEFGYVERNV